MHKEYPTNNQPINLAEEDLDALYEAQDIRRLKEAILLSDTEKFRLFTRMMRINTMLKNAKVTHKKIEE
ncbi:MAG: hypothetical protein KA174_00370 [Chitinophagales bacterium]|nr:hypothetical protein [Chitinophagales bacterium]